MPPPKTSFTYELDAEQQEKLLAMLAVGNYRPRQVPYSLVAVEGDGFNCALYQKEKHGRRKLCIQGSKAQDFVEFFLEPNVLGVATVGSRKNSTPAAAPRTAAATNPARAIISARSWSPAATRTRRSRRRCAKWACGTASR